MENILYSVVVPVYNTEKVLLKLVEGIQLAFDDLKISDFEIILINDCSPNPKTNHYLKQACQLNSNVKVIHFGRNFGQQPATICGIEESKGQFIITMDDDLQHSPADIKLLIEQQSHDIVIAKLKQKKHSFFKRVASVLKNYFDHIILGKPKHIQMSSFRLINRFVAEGMLKIKSPNPFIPALLFSVSLDVVNVPVQHYERGEGQSGYNFGKMFALFSNLLINNSSFLLRIIGRIGVVSFLVSVIYALVIIYQKMIFGIDTPGWTSIMVLLLFIGGLLLLSVGIVGEYLIRVIKSAEHKPSYFIKSIEGKS